MVCMRVCVCREAIASLTLAVLATEQGHVYIWGQGASTLIGIRRDAVLNVRCSRRGCHVVLVLWYHCYGC